MQRARRLVSVAVIASLAVAGLVGCRSETDVAAYLPGRTVSMDEVSDIYDEVEAGLAGVQTQNGQPAPMPITRDDIVDAMVSEAVLTELAKQNNVTAPPELPLERVAQSYGLPTTGRFTETFARAQVLLGAVAQSAKPAQLTQADLTDVFNRLNAAGGVPAGLTVDKFIAELPQNGKDTLTSAFSLRAPVQAQAEKMNIRVNPRFEPAEVSVLTDRDPSGKLLTLVAVPVPNSDGSVPVTDAA